MTTLKRRRIDVTITLGEGQFGDVASSAITLTGLRIAANIAAQGGDTQGQLQLRIYGLSLSDINQLTSIGPIATQVRRQNTVQVAAGNDGEALTVVYEGVIDSAYGDFQSAPEIALNLTAFSALAAAVVPIKASSWRGTTSVDTIMSTLAKQIGFAYENNGVTATLSNPYLPGTALTQIQECATAANINYSTDKKILSIWPRTGNRAGDIPTISPSTGMVGYPVFSSNGLYINSEFIPNIKQGGKVNIESEIPVARGTWNIGSVVHNLESERPGGAWFTQLQCFKIS